MTAELDAACFGCCERIFCSLADLLALVLGESLQHVHHELIGVWIVRCDEIDTTFHESVDEMNVSGQPVEFSNDQGCFRLLGRCYGGGKLGSVGSPSALDFAEFLDQRPGIGGNVPDYRLSLGFEPKAASPLAGGRNAVIRQELRGYGGLRNTEYIGAKVP